MKNILCMLGNCFNHLNMLRQSLTVSLLKQFVVKIFFWLCLYYFELFKITSTVRIFKLVYCTYGHVCDWFLVF